MKPERLEEIHKEAYTEGIVWMGRSVVRELLDHIAQLEARRGGADPWVPSGCEYDRMIHSSRDAAKWSDLFVATFPGLADKRDTMLGWFANAMMAMHDSIKQERGGAVVVPELTAEEAKGLVQGAIFNAIASREDGCWDWCDMILHGYRLAVSRIQPIPVDRVLKQGQCAIGIYEMQMLRDFAARRMSQREHDRLEACRDAHEAELRAQQAKGE